MTELADRASALIKNISGAKTAASTYGIPHVTRPVSKHDFEGVYKRFLVEVDQPTVDGVNVYLS